MDETTPRVRKVLVTVGSTLTAVEELRISAGSNVTLTATTSNRRTTLTIASSGGGGSSDHATLTHIAWTSSGHTGTASRLAGFNGSGAAAHYAIGTDVQAWDADLDALSAFSTTGWARRTGAGAWTLDTTIPWSSVSSTPTTLSGYGVTDAQPLDSDLTALASNTINGLWARTGTGTGSARTLTAGSAQITVTNGDGVSGNPTVDLAYASAVRETSGPTTLTMGAVADGQYLRRSGSVVVGTWLSLALATSGLDALDIPSDGGSALPFSLSSTAGSVA